jgi:hypothetical protein
MIPHDEGLYYYEAVLTFSKAPSLKELPVPMNPGEPSYEGYMLPGFPLYFQVRQNQNTSIQRSPEEILSSYNKLPKCRGHHVLERLSPDEPLKRARWVLANKTRHNLENKFEDALLNDFKTKDDISLKGYQYSKNSVGIEMDYRYNNCQLESLEALTDRDTWLDVMKHSKRQIVPNKIRVHFIFFGDSNIRNQHNFFRDHFARPTAFLDGRIKLTYVPFMEYWPLTWDKSRETFLNVTRDNPNDHFVTVYNLGLHEITNRCALFGQFVGRVKSKDAVPCLPSYQDDVRNMTQLVASKPAMVKIWQSTTAGWPKWGVFGVAWPQKKGQPFPQATDACADINKIAWNIVRKAGMKVMDTYWMTLSRPDHREVIDKDASRTSYKLVHMGPEVYLVLLRQLLTIALDALRNGKPRRRRLKRRSRNWPLTSLNYMPSARKHLGLLSQKTHIYKPNLKRPFCMKIHRTRQKPPKMSSSIWNKHTRWIAWSVEM